MWLSSTTHSQAHTPAHRHPRTGKHATHLQWYCLYSTDSYVIQECAFACVGVSLYTVASKKWLRGIVGNLLWKEKLGRLTTTDHRDTATETETQRREECEAGELGYKMIPALWGLIIIYAPGLFLSFLSRIKLITTAPRSPASPSAHFPFFLPPPPHSISCSLIFVLIGLSEVPTSKGTCYQTLLKKRERTAQDTYSHFKWVE